MTRPATTPLDKLTPLARHAARFWHTATLWVLIACLLPLAACNDFLDINDDPNNASPDDIASELDLVFLTGVIQLATTKTVEIVEHSSFVHLWSASSGASVFTNPELFQISSNTIGNSWEDVYLELGQNMEFIINTAEGASPAKPNAAAQAKIMQAYAYFHATQLWEDVPFTQANNAEEFPAPAFDRQEDVLRGIVAQLDEAIAQIDPDGLPGITTGDPYYDGDLSQWIRFANSTKFKVLMLLRSGGADVDADIAAVLQEPLVRTNADNTEFPYNDSPGNENSFWQVLADFSQGVNIWYDCADTMVDIMLDLGDPRLAAYCDEVEGGGFVGVPVGTFASLTDPAVSSVSLNIIRPSFPERITTAAEILLLEAEWRAERGDLAAANALFRQGVQASLDWFDNQPGDIDEAAKAAYLDSLPDLTTLAQAEAVRTIQVQQWIDLFERRPEAWTNWRRTKVPALEPPSNAILANIIRRYSYPTDAIARNPNTPESRQGDVPMWFEGAN